MKLRTLMAPRTVAMEARADKTPRKSPKSSPKNRMRAVVTGRRGDPFTQDDVDEYLLDIQAKESSILESEGEAGLTRFQREMCLSSIYYLGYHILGIEKMYAETKDGEIVYHPFVFNRCMEVQEEPDYCIDIWAREHFKSTIITTLLTIQDLLKDPNMAVCIYSYNATIARSFVASIRRNLEKNELRRLFPDIIPSEAEITRGFEGRDSSDDVQMGRITWSDAALTLKRSTARKEPSLSGYGLVRGGPTGMHFDLIVYDDVVTRDTVKTPYLSQDATEAWQNSINTGSGENVRVRIVGTRYSMTDTYGTIIQQGRYRLRQYPCMESVDGEDVPSLYTMEYLEQKRASMNGLVWASQMMCTPFASDTFRFDADWISERCDPDEVWRNRDSYNIYILVDPANTKSRWSDYNALVVVALGADGRYYVPDLIREKMEIYDRINALFALVRKWENSRQRPRVFYEKSAVSNDKSVIDERMRQTGYYFQFTYVSTRPRLDNAPAKVTKEARIESLSAKLIERRVVLASHVVRERLDGTEEDMMRSFVEEEYMLYPFCDHDDALDALSRIADQETGSMMLPPSRRHRAPSKQSGYDVWGEKGQREQADSEEGASKQPRSTLNPV